MTARSAFVALFFCILALGCRDEVENIVSSAEPDGGIIVEPNRVDRGLRDGEVPTDGALLDGGDAQTQSMDAEGIRIQQDGGTDALPGQDTAPPADAGPADTGPDAVPMTFPDHPLPPSECGRFGPREALHANPARVESYRHSGPGEWFDEPALFGCTPRSITWEDGEGDARRWQTFTFEYDGLRAVSSQWQFGEDMETTEMVRTLEVDQHGLVSRVRYDCGAEMESPQVELTYDERGRLTAYRRDSAAGCAALEVPLGTTIEYSYGSDDPLPSRVTIRVEAAELEMISDLEYTWADDRITRIDMRSAEGADQYRLFTYDDDGRISREEVWRTDEDKADRELSYQYDAEGRLVVKRDSATGQFRFQYDAVGELQGVEWPTGETLRARGHPETVSAIVGEGQR